MSGIKWWYFPPEWKSEIRTVPANDWLGDVLTGHGCNAMAGCRLCAEQSPPPGNVRPLRELLALIADMNEHELEFILFMVQRVAQGRKTYGPLNPYDGRDYKRDSVEERFDDAFYSWCDWKASK